MAPSRDDSFGRRAFFRNALTRTLRPLAGYLEQRIPGFNPSRAERSLGPSLPLRPPGAIAEESFPDACHRCGKCIEICPAKAIVSLVSNDPRQMGTPVIDADSAACVVCTGLQCTHVCPSGALLPVLDPRHIRMGLAEVFADRCVRTAGEGCSICVDHCPVGVDALRFEGSGPPVVLSGGCVGCGVCQLYCPTTPKAIVVRARA